uniref:Putative rRNA-processing protein EBP2-like protein n=1 Tax=Lygus hesperus TaxID=30085 RepID=A0A0A9Z5P7_LYGHE
MEELSAISPSIKDTVQSTLQSSKVYTCNEVGLHNKLLEIELPRDWPWIERLSIVSHAPITVKNIENDQERETVLYVAVTYTCICMEYSHEIAVLLTDSVYRYVCTWYYYLCFFFVYSYNSAIDAVKQAIIQLEQCKLPYKRPIDYYAESVKPDEHMETIKRILINEKQRIENVEKRKKEREDRRLEKRKHASKAQEVAKRKREAIANISKYKRRRGGLDAQSKPTSTFKRIVREQEKQLGKRGKSRP